VAILSEFAVTLEATFVKRMDNLARLFKLSLSDANDCRDTIIEAIEILSTGQNLPTYLKDHVLEKEPWTGYNEFHVLDDLLVVYYKVDAKKRIRMITVTNHEELSSGKLP
jgi:mRNA interferase YafQ